MKNDDYTGAKVTKNQWPDWLALPSGAFERRWTIEFEAAPDDIEVHSSGGLGQPDYEVSLERGINPVEFALTTTAHGNAWSDELFFFATYRLFERLEKKLGKIRKIQGQARNEWRPSR